MTRSIYFNYKRLILTAAHCICPFYDGQLDGSRSKANCLANSGNSFTNQHITDVNAPMNYLELKVGNRDLEAYHKNPITGKPLYPKAFPVDVEKAIIGFHETDKNGRVILGNSFDIGIIIPDADDRKLYDGLLLKHLRMPSR